MEIFLMHKINLLEELLESGCLPPLAAADLEKQLEEARKTLLERMGYQTSTESSLRPPM